MALVRVFVSHKQEDSSAATRVAGVLRAAPNVDVYIDVLDSQLRKSADDLTDYLRRQLGNCTHLMVVMSALTRESWWVPFEIGLATERAYPISTFATEAASLPEYLKKWPYLLTPQDLTAYIRVATQTRPSVLAKGLREATRSERGSYASEFHATLKRTLGQT
jgi:hypothetical protein